MNTGNNRIKSFVKNSLGCNCPDEVFEKIGIDVNVNINYEIIINKRLKVGGRLLIYFFKIVDRNLLKENLFNIIQYGKEERDNNGFNRLRIVLVYDKNILDELNDLFSSNQNIDDKIHLHLINENEYFF